MKILITHVYSQDNKGDAAIVSVLIEQLKKTFPSSVIKISTMEKITKKNHSFESIPLITSFTTLALFNVKNKLLKAINFCHIYSASLLWTFLFRITRRKANKLITKETAQLLEEYTQSDLIIPVGGGYIRGKNTRKDDLNIITVLHPLVISIILNKPVILYSQSIGPFGNAFQRFLVKTVINHTTLIIAREAKTVTILHNMGVKKSLIVQSVDAGFLFESNETTNLKNYVSSKESSERKWVGFTVRQWLEPKRQEQYEDAIAGLVKYITEKKKMNVIFIPQVTADGFGDDDRKVGKKILKKIGKNDHVYAIQQKLTHHQIKALYAQLDYLIGTRFHSVIFSLTSYVPAVAIEYEHKTSGIMKDLSLSKWVIKIEEVTTKNLISKFEELIKQKGSYKRSLIKKLPPYLEKAKKTILYAQDAYQEGKMN